MQAQIRFGDVLVCLKSFRICTFKDIEEMLTGLNHDGIEF